MYDSLCKLGISRSFGGFLVGLILFLGLLLGPGVLIWGPFWYYFGGLEAEGGQQQVKDANHDG